MRILIAEDDQVLADGLMRGLRNSGAAVDHVASGSEADAALMTNTEFDLLILDLGLPKMNGLEVLRRLRARGQVGQCQRGALAGGHQLQHALVETAHGMAQQAPQMGLAPAVVSGFRQHG